MERERTDQESFLYNEEGTERGEPVRELPDGEVRVSVRNLVEFILRHGDIDNRNQAAPDDAMQEGGRIHRAIQRRAGAEYQAEVPLKYTAPTEKCGPTGS